MQHSRALAQRRRQQENDAIQRQIDAQQRIEYNRVFRELDRIYDENRRRLAAAAAAEEKDNRTISDDESHYDRELEIHRDIMGSRKRRN